MFRRVRRFWFVPMLLLQAACTPMWAPYPSEPVPARRQPLIKPGPPPSPETRRPVQVPPEERTPARSKPAASPPAVLALLNEARGDLEKGDLDGAAASLERAIRIQPRNPELWHELAVVRLRQQQPGLAEEIARKSNLHARGNRALIRANWAIIAEARRLKGDAEGAEDARRKAGD